MDISRVILYCIVCSDTSGDYVHQYIGKEPSGGSAEALTLKDSAFSLSFRMMCYRLFSNVHFKLFPLDQDSDKKY